MQLRYDPYGIFRNSKSPAGLYARRKWLGESEDPSWERDFDAVVAALSKRLKSTEPGWKGIITDIDSLFGLHLTQRSPDVEIDSVLDGLMDKISLQGDGIKIETGGGSMDKDLKNLPFVNSQWDMLLLAATLFLATIFGRGRDPAVINLFECLNKKGAIGKSQRIDPASTHNIMRAMVVHPVFSKSEFTSLAVDRLAGKQLDTGEWADPCDFYQTLNAIAHLDLPQADAQLDKAFQRLRDIQKVDGTWSESEPEWNTFLVVHALKNKGIL
jgi:hypothetical protein